MAREEELQILQLSY